VRLAYLCNLYPAVSHSFVRREIEGVERCGHEVHRFSLRPARDDLRDEADVREAACTEAVLGQGAVALVASTLALALSRPVKTMTAVRAAFRLAGPGTSSKFRHLAYWLEAAWLVRRMARLGVEHLHAHFGTNPAAVAAIARSWGGPPFSFTVHGPDEFDAPIALSLGAKVEASSFVAAVSSYGRSQLMRWSDPRHWDKIGVVRCGLDSAFREAAPQDISEDSRDLLCVARLSAQKGLPLLMGACDALRQRGKEFTLTIVGDGELRSMIESEIRERRLEEVVRLTGVQTAKQIREHLQRSRGFVLPSFAEGLPVVLMEALALSRPVITTAIAGIPELVDEQCGWLIPAGSQDALVEAMTALLDTPVAELTSKGAVGRERVLRLHDADRNARLLLEAISPDQAASPIEASTAS